MEEYTVRLRNDLWICEVSNKGTGFETMWIWKNARPDLPLMHALNLPSYNKADFYAVELSGADGHSIKYMSKIAANYGFFKLNFILAFKEWKNKTNKITTTSPQ